MAAASLVVRISADLNDFSRQLQKATKDVTRAADQIASIGNAMSIGLTLPLVAAGAAMMKFGADAAAASAKLDREFGGSATAMRTEIEQLRLVVPETTTALMQMANQVDQFAQGAGMAAPQAALLSENVLKMAADLQAANPGTSMQQATDALMHSLEGSTKSLRDFGVGITEAQVKSEAYTLGLLGAHQALTPLGTALATYAVLTQRLATLQGAALTVQEETDQQWAFLKRDVMDLAKTIGAQLQPAFSTIIQAGRDLIGWMSNLSTTTMGTAIAVGVFAAALGPTITFVVELTAAANKLWTALKLLMAGDALEGLIAVLTAPEVIVAVAALTAAIYGLSKAWAHFHDEAAAGAAKKGNVGPLSSVSALIGAGGGKSGATATSTLNPLQALQAQAAAVKSQFDDAATMGQSLVKPFDDVVALNTQALALYAAQHDQLEPNRPGAPRDRDRHATPHRCEERRLSALERLWLCTPGADRDRQGVEYTGADGARGRGASDLE